MCFCDQGSTNALPLAPLVHCKVGQVAAVPVVGHGPAHTHQRAAGVAGCHNDRGAPQHLLQLLKMVIWASLPQSAAFEDAPKLLQSHVWLQAIANILQIPAHGLLPWLTLQLPRSLHLRWSGSYKARCGSIMVSVAFRRFVARGRIEHATRGMLQLRSRQATREAGCGPEEARSQARRCADLTAQSKIIAQGSLTSKVQILLLRNSCLPRLKGTTISQEMTRAPVDIQLRGQTRYPCTCSLAVCTCLRLIENW
mmetsp:Transcript_19395/g.58613  ORF Transcript_19395/g.58613 Transcript_19395/m.58613 type:complete len:253 (-) Transcript_19395:98-856(-)